jgi:hypothetical protein
MRAFMSRKDEYAADPLRSPVSNLKPDLFASDLAWIEAQSMSEARAILATVKPSADPWPEILGTEWDASTPVWNLAPWEKRGACYRDLAADLSAFVNE